MSKDFEQEISTFESLDFHKALGIQCLEIRENYCKCMIDLTPAHRNPIGSVHGGVVFSLADTVGGHTAYTTGKFPTTLSGSINYLRPAIKCKQLFGESKPVKIGKNTAVYEISITDEEGNLIALTTLTYFFLKEELQESLHEKYRKLNNAKKEKE